MKKQMKLVSDYVTAGVRVPVGFDYEYDMCRLDDMDTFEKIKLIAILLDISGNAHIDLENGSDMIKAIGHLALVETVVAEMKKDYINMAI